MMPTTNTPAVAPNGVPTQVIAQQVTQEQAQAWVGMAQAKNDLVAELTRQELASQALLAPLASSNSHAEIDAALATYRKAHTQMVEVRKTFTSQIEAAIITPLMAFEKRVDPKSNPTYLELGNRSLALRKEEEDKAQRINAINQELANFKAFVQNEFFRIAAEYRNAVRGEIHNQYNYWLKERVSPEIDRIKAHLLQIPVPPIGTFTPRVVTNEQLAEVYTTIPRPDFEAIYKEMMKEVDEVFANFDSDMGNIEAALKAKEEHAKIKAMEEQKKATEEAAINTLIVQAETVTVEAPKIKRTVEVVIVESEAWAKTVMAAFITNLPHLAKYIRVKSWAKLSIGQMAEYLGRYASDTGDMAKGLEYKEVEK